MQAGKAEHLAQPVCSIRLDLFIKALARPAGHSAAQQARQLVLLIPCSRFWWSSAGTQACSLYKGLANMRELCGGRDLSWEQGLWPCGTGHAGRVQAQCSCPRGRSQGPGARAPPRQGLLQHARCSAHQAHSMCAHSILTSVAEFAHASAAASSKWCIWSG